MSAELEDQAAELERPMPATLEGLNGGWPFGEGPAQWRFTVDWREGTENQAPGLHLVCAECHQSMTRLGAWAHTLASLKPQIAGHVMQVHLEQTVR